MYIFYILVVYIYIFLWIKFCAWFISFTYTTYDIWCMHYTHHLLCLGMHNWLQLTWRLHGQTKDLSRWYACEVWQRAWHWPSKGGGGWVDRGRRFERKKILFHWRMMVIWFRKSVWCWIVAQKREYGKTTFFYWHWFWLETIFLFSAGLQCVFEIVPRFSIQN